VFWPVWLGSGPGMTDREEDKREAQRPLEEAGQGEAEGFEQAEEQLRRRAEHRDAGGNPKYDRPDPEPDESEATYGEADHERSSEVEDPDA
jgi:hypothetical protein